MQYCTSDTKLSLKRQHKMHAIKRFEIITVRIENKNVLRLPVVGFFK